MANERLTRKLSAILAADVVGYSRLMGEDEAATLRNLKICENELIEPTVQEHNGRIFKRMGDGFLVEFPSAVDSVECALDWQARIKAKGHALQFRIGINLSDVIAEKGDMYGNGVNIAARIESLAEPNEIYISQEVYSQVENKIKIGFEDLGEHDLKNIEKPIRVYKILPDVKFPSKNKARKSSKPRQKIWVVTALLLLVMTTGIGGYFYSTQTKDFEPASIERMMYPLPEKPSIAVIPFANLSEDDDQEYFADGITEDIITDLSKISGLFVVASGSTFRFKGKDVKFNEIAEKLGVRHILKGSVRRSGDQMRINIQLIDAVKGTFLWAERYDRKNEDIFYVQDEVTQKVVSELAVTLKTSEQEQLFRKHTESLDAYETFLKARRVLDATMADTMEAKKLFERVIELDPKFAGGYAGLSLIHSRMVRHGFSTSPIDDKKRSTELAQKAVATDSTFGWSYLALASAYLNELKHDEAIAAMEEAIRIQPGSADAYLFLGFYLHWAGYGDEAIESVKKSIRLNPASMGPTSFILGMSYFTAGRYEEAIATIAPKYDYVARKGHLILCFLSASYVATNQDERARKVMKEFLVKHPDFAVSNYPHVKLYKRETDRERYAGLLLQAGMPE